jgi:adenylate cyclase
MRDILGRIEGGMPQPVERRLAAILVADVAGYSRLMEADEEGTLTRLRAHRRVLIDPKICEHRGRIVKTTGDGVLVEFASVVDAVRCAAEIQRGMLDREAIEAEDRRIRFRIGVNLGDIMIDDADIFGDGVNVAARLEGLAEPGGICISRVVRDQIRNKLSFAFDDMGEQSVKNIARPVHAYALCPSAVAALPPVSVAMQHGRAVPRRIDRRILVALAAAILMSAAVGGWWERRGHSERTGATTAASEAKPAPTLSIVVLPFENLSKDPDQEYFADGVTDDLTTDLSRISGSFVISRTTAFTYKGKAIDVRQIGRDLGVRYVLEGSVRRSGDHVHVNVQLIDAASESHVWADQFDTDRRDLTDTQSEITGRLARELGLALVRDASRRIEQEHAADPDAQDLVMRAQALSMQVPFIAADKRQALRDATIGLLERALAVDPGSVDAKISLALRLVGGVADGFSNSVEQDNTRAERLIQEALQRDPDQSQAHAALGLLRRVQGRWSEAQAEFETAITLDQNNAFAIRQLGITLETEGKPEEAIPYLEKAIRLDARAPNIFTGYVNLANCYLFLGHTDEALSLYRRARALAPTVWYVHDALAAALGLKGDIDEGKREIAEMLKLKPDANSIARLRAIAATLGFASPALDAMAEKTLNVGIRRLGFPEK